MPTTTHLTRRLITVALAGGILLSANGCADDRADATGDQPHTRATATTSHDGTTAATTIAAPAPTTAAPIEKTTKDVATTTVHRATPPSAPSAAHIAEPGAVTVVASDFRFDSVPELAMEGSYELTMRNEGAEAHELVLFRHLDDLSLEDLEALGPPAAVEHMELRAFMSAAPGDTTASSTVELTPGVWQVVCFFPTTDGSAHFHHGMARTITVVAG